MTSVPVNGIEFHVEEIGSGEPLVLLHGFTGSSAAWLPVIDGLARHHRAVAIDLIGHGASSAPSQPSRYAFGQALEDLAQVAVALGIDRAIWLGYSMGGRLALGMALQYPSLVSALILESATPGIQVGIERTRRGDADELLARRITRIGIEAFVDEWERRAMWDSQRALPAAILQRQRAQRLRNQAIGLANTLRGMGQGAQSSLWDRLGEIEVPVLLFAGALDAKFADIAAGMHDGMPMSTLSVVPNTGHAIHLERPDVFIDRVKRFVETRGSLSGIVQ